VLSSRYSILAFALFVAFSSPAKAPAQDPIIDRDGKIAARFKGETDLNSMESRLRSLLHTR
jgi:hypothetical protein